MNEVEKVKLICKERKIPIATLEKECKFANGYIQRLKKGIFPSDRLIKIANYLKVPIVELSETAAATLAQINGKEVYVNPEVLEAMEGPYKDKLIAYAKKLNELKLIENE